MSATTEFEEDGCTVVENVLRAVDAERAAEELEILGHDGAGTRSVLQLPAVRAIVELLRSNRTIREVISPCAVAVQCTFFEKSATRNWLVAPHQDLSIPVRTRIDHPALAGWSRKEDSYYVQPPSEVLSQLTAVRVHLDECGAEHGPLRVIPGSQRAGVLRPAELRALTAKSAEHRYTVSSRSALLMKPLVVHASSKARQPNRRRVLHYLFGPRQLPFGLEWADAV